MIYTVQTNWVSLDVGYNYIHCTDKLGHTVQTNWVSLDVQELPVSDDESTKA